MTNFTSRDFRDALAKFATGVTIVTSQDAAGEPVGMTASSFNSVSMEPPLILWSVTKTTQSADAFKAAEHFAVHVLNTDQVELSNKFAKSGSDKFSGLDVSLNAQDIPVLPQSLARFDCKTWAVHEGGDHWIIIGQVLDLVSSHGDGLVFSAGSYAKALSLTEDQVTEQSAANSLIEDTLLYQLSRAYHALTEGFETQLEAAQISREDWRVLSNLADGKALGLNVLAKRTLIGERSLQAVLSSLEAQGYVQLTDQSVKGTEAGHQRLIGLIQAAKHQEADLLKDQAPNSRKQLLKNLEALHR